MIISAICDDEAKTRAYLSALIRRQPYPCEIVEYVSADNCLEDNREIDLLFLDIKLNASNSDGMVLARKIRGRKSSVQPVIVFVTGYEQYVFDAFDVGAFQYLLKPVDEDKFAQVFARAAELIETRRERPQSVPTLTIQYANVKKAVPLESIYYTGERNNVPLRRGDVPNCVRTPPTPKSASYGQKVNCRGAARETGLDRTFLRFV